MLIAHNNLSHASTNQCATAWEANVLAEFRIREQRELQMTYAKAFPNHLDRDKEEAG